MSATEREDKASKICFSVFVFFFFLKITRAVKNCPFLDWLPGCWRGLLCKRGLELCQWVACALADK